MNPLDMLSIIRKQTDAVKAAGHKAVSVPSLESLLSLLEHHAKEAYPISPTDLEGAQLRQTEDLAYYTAVNASNLELFKSVISTAKILINSLILINGGAAVALLAFIGHLATAPSSSASVSDFAAVLLWFVVGVGAAALFAGFVCLSQKAYSSKWQRFGHVTVVVSVLTAIASFVAFGLGAYNTYWVFVWMSGEKQI
jgi:hypothetical protein